MKPRHHLYLDEDVSDALNALAARPGMSKSGIVSNALRGFLKRKGSHEIDDFLKQRFGQFDNRLSRIERDCEILLESLALFVRYMLAAIPPLAEDDEAGRALARQRFEAFIARVGRQVASERRSFAVEPKADPR